MSDDHAILDVPKQSTFRYEIDLPFVPPTCLGPNHKGHWSEKWAATGEVRGWTKLMARQQYGDFTGQEEVVVSAEIGWAGNRKPVDENSAWGSVMKAVQDGLQDWLGINDRQFRTGTLTQVRDPEKKGYVKLWLEVRENRPTEKTSLADSDRPISPKASRSRRSKKGSSS
jgi:hypothetical protein